MKDLGNDQKILGINIFRNKREFVLVLHQEPYVLKILQKSNMSPAKTVFVPLAAHFLLSIDLCHKILQKSNMSAAKTVFCAFSCSFSVE